MKFSDLSKGQKRCVLSLLKANEELKTTSSVSRKIIVETWTYIKDAGSKVGFPNWLLTSQFKNSKGLYVIPKPTAKDIEEYNNPPKKTKKAKQKREKSLESGIVSKTRLEFNSNKLSEEDMEYYSILDRYSVPF